MGRFSGGRLAPGLLVLAMITTLAAACSGTAGRAGGAAPEIHPSWTSCDEAVPGGVDGAVPTDLPRLNDEFLPAKVVVCRTGAAWRADGGQDIVATEASAPVTEALLAALRQPDEPRTNNPCTADLRMVPWFALLTADGRWIHPGTPIDSCGKIHSDVISSLDDLDLTTVSTRVVRELEPAPARGAGCPLVSQDMITIRAVLAHDTWAPLDTEQLPGGGMVRLCRYAAADGQLTDGYVLTDKRWEQIRSQIEEAEPPAECTDELTSFAMLQNADFVGGWVLVELDGCKRIMVIQEGSTALLAANPTLLELLALDQ